MATRLIEFSRGWTVTFTFQLLRALLASHTQIISEFQKNPVDNVEEFAIDTKVMI